MIKIRITGFERGGGLKLLIRPALCIVPVHKEGMGFEPEGAQNLLNTTIQPI